MPRSSTPMDKQKREKGDMWITECLTLSYNLLYSVCCIYCGNKALCKFFFPKGERDSQYPYNNNLCRALLF